MNEKEQYEDIKKRFEESPIGKGILFNQDVKSLIEWAGRYFKEEKNDETK
jgi:hypothetical protein